MATLLRLDSSPLAEKSISRQLTETFVQTWREAHPEGTVTTRDLSKSHLPVPTADWISAIRTPKENQTADQQRLSQLSDELISELETADEYVIGVPMHNFGIPSVLKLWIDHIARSGRTFSYGKDGPVGLLQNKKATFLVASGAVYREGTPFAGMNFVEPYLRAVFGFLGVSAISFIAADGVAQIATGQVDPQVYLQPTHELVKARSAA